MAEPISFDFSEQREALTKQSAAVTRLGAKAVRRARTVDALSEMVTAELQGIRKLASNAQSKSRAIDTTIESLVEALQPELVGKHFRVTGTIFGLTVPDEKLWINPSMVDVTDIPVIVKRVIQPRQDASSDMETQKISHRLYWGSPDLPKPVLRTFRREFYDQPYARDNGAYFDPNTPYPDINPVVTLALTQKAREAAGLAVGNIKEVYGYDAGMVFARLEDIVLTPVISPTD